MAHGIRALLEAAASEDEDEDDSEWGTDEDDDDDDDDDGEIAHVLFLTSFFYVASAPRSCWCADLWSNPDRVAGLRAAGLFVTQGNPI